MGLFTDGFKLLKKASEPLYKTPKSIQETIEIMAVAENGIFEVSRNKYSKCYRFQDINYTTATEDEQIGIFERYCKFLNSLDCNYKITINNKNKNMDELRDKVLIAEKNDGFNNYRRIYNDIIEEKIIEGRQGIEQERYLTITIERKNFEEAKAQFATLEATIHKAFIELGAEIVPLNGNERLKVLYDYYHLGDEGSFDFDIKAAKKVGADFKNDLCNGMVKYFPDHFEDESKYCKALFIKKYPSSLSDRFINEITSLPVHSITSIDVVPVPKDLTTKVLQKKYLGIESDIIKQQRVRNKNNDFSTEISYAKRTEKKEIEAIMDDVRENDQCLFFVGVTIILMAESKKELESVCETVETIGKRNSCTIDTHYLKQREALNTALPIGVRQVETMRTLLTQSLAVLMPFNVQELNDSTGNYYGINQISKNVNIGNRKKLINGNGFVFGVPGSGKSFFCKMEMGSVFLSGDDEIIVIDPMNEYFDTDIRFKILNVDTLAVMYDSAKDDDTHKTSFTGSGGWCCAEKARLTTVVGTEYYLVVYCTNPTEGVSLRTGSIATAVGNPVMCAASTKIIPGTSVTATGSGYSSTRTFSVSGDDIPNTAQVRTISLSGTGMSKIKRWRLMAPNKSVWVANESDFYPSINFNFVNDSSSNAKLKGTWSVAFQSSSSSYTFIPSYSVSYYYEYGD